jgi:hypothetical protein
MDALEASVSSRLDEDTGSARPKPNDKPTSLSERDKGNQSGEKRTRCSTGSKSGFSEEKSSSKEPDLGSLSAKIDKLTDIVGEVVPIVRQLKAAHDEDERSRGELEDDLLDGSSSEGDVHPDKHEEDSSPESAAKRRKLDSSEGGIVDSLVLEVTDTERTGTALPDKIASVLDNILSRGLKDQAATARKETIKRPENCKLLSVTKVNQEIWDIAHHSTRSMDSRLQKMQELLIKGLTPIATLAGSVGETMESSGELPDKTQVWSDLSTAMVLIAGANHELNMCRRDMFKADLDKDYKALCNNKHPVEGELFGSDLIERLKTVKESNKASKQLTKYQSGFTKRSGRENDRSRGPFLSQRRGKNQWGHPRKNYDVARQKKSSQLKVTAKQK